MKYKDRVYTEDQAAITPEREGGVDFFKAREYVVVPDVPSIPRGVPIDPMADMEQRQRWTECVKEHPAAQCASLPRPAIADPECLKPRGAVSPKSGVFARLRQSIYVKQHHHLQLPSGGDIIQSRTGFHLETREEEQPKPTPTASASAGPDNAAAASAHSAAVTAPNEQKAQAAPSSPKAKPKPLSPQLPERAVQFDTPAIANLPHAPQPLINELKPAAKANNKAQPQPPPQPETAAAARPKAKAKGEDQTREVLTRSALS